MTQITLEQQQQMEAAARSVAMKLQGFHDGLTADEQQMLGLGFGALAASRAGEDVAGYGYIDGIGEVRDWCLTWQYPWGVRWPLPAQPPRVVS